MKLEAAGKMNRESDLFHGKQFHALDPAYLLTRRKFDELGGNMVG